MVNFSRKNINLETAGTAVMCRSYFIFHACMGNKAILCEWEKRQYSLQNEGRPFDERSASFVYTDLKLILWHGTGSALCC